MARTLGDRDDPGDDVVGDQAAGAAHQTVAEIALVAVPGRTASVDGVTGLERKIRRSRDLGLRKIGGLRRLFSQRGFSSFAQTANDERPYTVIGFLSTILGCEYGEL